jgi:aryl-alcohol dehydrogenase-like predicted oxidoreductase
LQEATAIAAKGSARFVSVQNEFSLVHREPEREVLPECLRLGIQFLPYFPLASGLLTGKYRRGQAAPEETRLSQGWAASRFATDEKMATAEALDAFARSRNRSLLELAMSWLASHEMVASVISGATSAAQVRQNVAACGWELTQTDLEEIDRIAPLR